MSFKIQRPSSLSHANPPGQLGAITMVTMCKGRGGFTLVQLMLRFCERGHVSLEAGSVQGTSPTSVLGTTLAASSQPALLPVSTSASYSKPEPQKCHVYSSRELRTVWDQVEHFSRGPCGLAVKMLGLLGVRLPGPLACRRLVTQRPPCEPLAQSDGARWRVAWVGAGGPSRQDVKMHLWGPDLRPTHAANRSSFQGESALVREGGLVTHQFNLLTKCFL